MYDSDFLNKLFKFVHFYNKKIYFVGGFVRNYLINKTHNAEIDLSTNLDIHFFATTLNQHLDQNIKILTNNIKYGTINLVHDNNIIDVTQTRLDIKTYGRTADIAISNDFIEDSNRRDFSINAIYMDNNFNYLDFHNGINDLKNKKLKFIGNPDKRIQEDYLRILRYFRFADNIITKFDNNLALLCQEYKNNLSILSKERITKEIKKISKSVNSFFIFYNLSYYKILENIFPSIDYKKNVILTNNFEDCELIPFFAFILTSYKATKISYIFDKLNIILSLTKLENKIISLLKNNFIFLQNNDFNHNEILFFINLPINVRNYLLKIISITNHEKYLKIIESLMKNQNKEKLNISDIKQIVTKDSDFGEIFQLYNEINIKNDFSLSKEETLKIIFSLYQNKK